MQILSETIYSSGLKFLYVTYESFDCDFFLQQKFTSSWKTYMIFIEGVKGYWDFRISDLTKTLIELIFNPYGEFRWSPEGPVSQIHSPHLHIGAPGIFSDL